MKRYLAFAGENYYPSGGACDLLGDFDKMTKCVKGINAAHRRVDWWNILDTQTGAIYNNHDAPKNLLAWAKRIDNKEE
jgi:hypothetical protein